MRTTESIRLELLDALVQLSRIRPEWRLGQTLANLAMTAGRLDAGGIWDLEDEEALAAARTLIDQYSDIEPTIAEIGRDHTAIAASQGDTGSLPPQQVN
jgi:hypothetical protein